MDRKGQVPGRGSLSEPVVPPLPRVKSGSSGGPGLVPVVDINDGPGNNINTTNSPESVHSDGKHAYCR